MRIGLKAQVFWLSTGSRVSWGGTLTNGIQIGPAPAGLQRVTRVQDITQPLEKEAADGTTRDSSWEKVAGTIRKGPINYKMLFDPENDTAHVAMFEAFCQDQVYVPLLVASDILTNFSLNYGIWADWEIMKFNLGNTVKGLREVDVMIQPSVFSTIEPQMVRIAAS